jgi:methionyl-tRNA formyltransferase
VRIVFFGNNRVGWQVLKTLRESGEEIAGIALHPPGRRQFGGEILAAANLAPESVLDGSRLSDPAVIGRLRELQPEIGISAFFGYLLRKEVLALFPRGVINLHPALLPYNRGAYPNAWSILDGTPAGATTHAVDEGIDTGDILARREVPAEPIDTAKTLYRKLEKACVELFADSWPAIRDGAAVRQPQPSAAGTFHRVRDIEELAEIDPEQSYPAGRLLDLIRAQTFPPYRGAFIRRNGRKIYLRMELLYEESLKGPVHGNGHPDR